MYILLTIPGRELRTGNAGKCVKQLCPGIESGTGYAEEFNWPDRGQIRGLGVFQVPLDCPRDRQYIEETVASYYPLIRWKIIGKPEYLGRMARLDMPRRFGNIFDARQSSDISESEFEQCRPRL